MASRDFNTRDLGVKGGYHSLSHHGKKKDSIEQLFRLHAARCDDSKDLQGWEFVVADSDPKYRIKNKTTNAVGGGRCIVSRDIYGSDLIVGGCGPMGSGLRGRDNKWHVTAEADLRFPRLRRLDADGNGTDRDTDDDGDGCFVDPDDSDDDVLQCPDMFCSVHDAEHCRDLQVGASNTKAGCINAGAKSYCLFEWYEPGRPEDNGSPPCELVMVEPFQSGLFGLDMGSFCGIQIDPEVTIDCPPYRECFNRYSYTICTTFCGYPPP